MKKHLSVLAVLLLALVAISKAMTPVYTDFIINETGITYDKTYSIDLNTAGNGGAPIDELAAQAVYSSHSYTTPTFTDGHVSTGSLAVVSTAALAAAAAHNSITVVSTAALAAASASNTLTVASTNGLTGASFTINNVTLTEGVDWTATGYASSTAKSISRAILSNTILASVVTSTYASATGVVTVTARATGTNGNDYILYSSTPAALSANATNFAGGRPSAYLTINGQLLRNGVEWTAALTASGTAKSISDAIMAKTNLTAVLSSTWTSGGVVSATATATGTAGNAYTLESSTPAALTVASANFAGGQANITLNINGVALTQGTAWTAVPTATGTAKAISDAIMAHAYLSTIIQTTWTAAGVVTATSVAIGDVNYPLVTSNTAGVTVFAERMYGGTASAYTLNAAAIHAPAHGLTTGLGVWFSTASGVGLSPLAYGTTYYAIRTDADNFQLALTSTGAAAGTYITLTSSVTAGGDTFSVVPVAFAGTWAFKWQASNDGTNWFDLSESSVTYSAPGTTGWDLSVNYRYLRVNVDAGTGGGLTLQVIGNGKNNNAR